MSRYLLIESRDPFDTREVANDYQLAADLARDGNDTTLFLIQNGVMPVRKGALRNGLHALIESGVKVICDEFSLRERGIYSESLTEGVEIGPLDIVIEHLTGNSKTIWL
jgi:predicted peroxiredoxin